MTACRCQNCSETPDPKYTMEWRRKCEISTVLTMTKDARAGYYAKVAKA